MNTPDTEKHPADALVGFNPLTPDTEWEKEFDHLSVSILLREKDPTYGEENRRAKQQLKTFITTLLTSRDTYWKERVYEMCGLDDPECWHGGMARECKAEQCEQRVLLQALDNLK